MTAAVLEKLRAVRPIRINVAKDQTKGRFWWQCTSCPISLDSCGWSATIADAADEARAHRLADCPEAAAASSRLLADVLKVPTFRLVARSLSTGEELYACSLCPAYLHDQDEHVEFHLIGTVFA